MATTSKDILKSARELIADSAHWCQEDLVETRPDGSYAYCALGAVNNATYQLQAETDDVHRKTYFAECRTIAIWRLEEAIDSNQRLAAFNDDLRTTHADVLAVFDKAINADERG